MVALRQDLLKAPELTENPDAVPSCLHIHAYLISDFEQATTITVANLYYVQPILFKIADTFDVSFEEASSVATLLQAGYAAGLLLICPLGDIFRRRPFILLLVLFTATLVSEYVSLELLVACVNKLSIT